MEVIKNRIYKHFKGDYYLVLDLATHTETYEKMVIYIALYNEGEIFARPYDSFVSKVDKNKYPNVTQANKFELQNINSVVKK